MFKRLKNKLQNVKGVLFGTLFDNVDKVRLETAVAWLSRSKLGIVLLNIAIASVLLAVQTIKKLKMVWRRSENPMAGSANTASQQPLPLASTQTKPRVLLLVEPTIPQCFHYRVQQKISQLQDLGCYVEWQPWSEVSSNQQRMHFVDIVMFYRAPGFPKVMQSIHYAKALGKLVCYDIDDLIFDRDKLAEKFKQTSQQLSDKDLQGILDGAELYKKAIAACSYGIASTPLLQAELAKLLEKKQCYLLPNGLDETILSIADLPQPEKSTEQVTIFYGSGTKTHDEDFALVGDVLARLMQQYSQVQLVVAGHLTLPKALQQMPDRVQRLPLMDFSAFLYSLRQADIAIAPLESGLFADCKSEIKWLEAAAMGVPTVVSDTARYRDMIQSGENGFIATNSDQWFTALERLITDVDLRQTMQQNAMSFALTHYAPAAMAQQMQQLLTAMQQQAVQDGLLCSASDELAETDGLAETKKRLLFVNVLYPPQAIGGATTVVENIVQSLCKDYAADYTVSVLTCEVLDQGAYQLREYAQDGVQVTVVGVPYRDNLETQHADAKMRQLCVEWLAQNRPDLIHFHSMQRLTASVLKAAYQLSIPYVVTVHDAWWLSEHQFLLDANDDLVDERQLNPLIATQTANDLALAVKRAQYLATRLQQAQTVIAVSKYQADIYRRNGFANVVINRNGVGDKAAHAVVGESLDETKLEKPSSNKASSNKLRIGYLGGQSAHKGYDFLREIVQSNPLANLEFVVVDLFKDAGSQAQQQWGQSTVHIQGKYAAADMAAFYAQIDVLIAPSIWPESFGLVSREAALHGVWVIAADAGGMAEDIIHGETGFVFPMRDAKQCTALLQNMNTQYEHYQQTPPQLAKSQQQIVSIDEQVQELSELYQYLLAERLA